MGLGEFALDLFRYQRVVTGKVNSLRWGPDPKGSLNTSGFALPWNIGFYHVDHRYVTEDFWICINLKPT